MEYIRAALTDQIIAQAETKGKAYKLSDGGGMHLLMHPNGSKYWRIDYRFGGKQKSISLGVYPDVSLDDARKRRDDPRNLLAKGINTSTERRATKEALIADKARQIANTLFILDHEGALSFRLGNRYISFTCEETSKLRAFLDATRAVTPEVTPCP